MDRCPVCGGTVVGDGYLTAQHCEYVDCPPDREADAPPLYCKWLHIRYRNWRGEVRWRTIHPICLTYRPSQWHGSDAHWILEAEDRAKGKVRDFLLSDILQIRESEKEDAPSA